MDEIRKCLEKLCEVRETREPTIRMQPTLQPNTSEPPITTDPSRQPERKVQSIEKDTEPVGRAQNDELVVRACTQGEAKCEFVKSEPLSAPTDTDDWVEKRTTIPLDGTPKEVLVGVKAKRDPRKRKRNPQHATNEDGKQIKEDGEMGANAVKIDPIDGRHGAFDEDVLVGDVEFIATPSDLMAKKSKQSGCGVAKEKCVEGEGMTNQVGVAQCADGKKRRNPATSHHKRVKKALPMKPDSETTLSTSP